MKYNPRSNRIEFYREQSEVLDSDVVRNLRKFTVAARSQQFSLLYLTFPCIEAE